MEECVEELCVVVELEEVEIVATPFDTAPTACSVARPVVAAGGAGAAFMIAGAVVAFADEDDDEDEEVLLGAKVKSDCHRCTRG